MVSWGQEWLSAPQVTRGVSRRAGVSAGAPRPRSVPSAASSAPPHPRAVLPAALTLTEAKGTASWVRQSLVSGNHTHIVWGQRGGGCKMNGEPRSPKPPEGSRSPVLWPGPEPLPRPHKGLWLCVQGLEGGWGLRCVPQWTAEGSEGPETSSLGSLPAVRAAGRGAVPRGVVGRQSGQHGGGQWGLRGRRSFALIREH